MGERVPRHRVGAAGQGLRGLGQATFGLAMQSQPEVQWLMPQLPTHKPVAK